MISKTSQKEKTQGNITSQVHREHREEKNIVPSQSFKWYVLNSRTSTSFSLR